METKSPSVEVKVGDEFYRPSDSTVEVYRLTVIVSDKDPDEKKEKKQLIYTFETFINGIRSDRPMFSMGKKWFEDLIERKAWKRKS